MKYLLMMHLPPGAREYDIFDWPPEALQAHMAHLDAINRDLAAAGELVDIEALTPPSQARLVRAGRGGAPVTDGPFAESKEFLAGFWIIDVDAPERAHAIAARASAAPGRDGKPLDMAIEVRQVMEGPAARGNR
ncbi:MAG TPA: YciI family protein [Gemmatimonadaceae bacterium]|nr:YciI family protein [Gemmatimonadaceae bacterium]